MRNSPRIEYGLSTKGIITIHQFGLIYTYQNAIHLAIISLLQQELHGGEVQRRLSHVKMSLGLELLRLPCQRGKAGQKLHNHALISLNHKTPKRPVHRGATLNSSPTPRPVMYNVHKQNRLSHTNTSILLACCRVSVVMDSADSTAKPGLRMTVYISPSRLFSTRLSKP